MGLAKAVQGLKEGVWEGVVAWRQNTGRVRGGEKKRKAKKTFVYSVKTRSPK